MINLDIMDKKFLNYRTGVNTLGEAKKAAHSKWGYILKNRDKIDWEDIDTQKIIWHHCGFCVYRDNQGAICSECQLYPHCDRCHTLLSEKEPLHKIMEQIFKYRKPFKKDLKAFIKIIENIEVK